MLGAGIVAVAATVDVTKVPTFPRYDRAPTAGTEGEATGDEGGESLTLDVMAA
jgi:hypothetical protein